MILKALYDYYQRKADDPDSQIAPQGLEWKEIPFIIVIDEDGKFVNLEDTRENEGKKKIARKFLVIKSKGRPGKNSWQTANVFWDHYGYVLTQPKDDKKKTPEECLEDAQKQNKTFVSVVDKTVKAMLDNTSISAVKKFYERVENISDVKNHDLYVECLKIPRCNMTFRISGKTNVIAEEKDLVDLYAKADEGDESYLEISTCLITGNKEPIALLHTGTTLPGGKAGGKLIGFQKNSGYDSYYKQQGANAPVSKYAEAAYTTALNVMLSKDSLNKFRLCDTVYLFWSEKKNSLEDGFSFLFNAPAKDDPDRNVQEVRSFLQSIHSGKIDSEGNSRFYVLGLAPNAARISIRIWKHGTVKEFSKNIAQHFSDLDIVHGTKDVEFFTLFNLLSHTAFEYKVDNVQPNLAGAVMDSVLDGDMYPATLQQQCLRRIKAEQKVNRIRAAILKACINRKMRIRNYTNEKEIKVALDIDNRNQGYLCGRLFAVLEKIQKDALGIETIKERFYGAASCTPTIVFGRLLRLSNHHLAKLETGKKINKEKLLQEIVGLVRSDGFPKHLNLDDQSRFAIGYYHQRQDFFKTKIENEG